MSAAGLTAVADVITVLGGWNNANTDSITPKFVNGLDTPWQSLDFGSQPILYVKLNVDVIHTGMYALEFYHKIALTVEVMSAQLHTYARFKKMVDEAVRVVKANARQVGYAFTVVRSIQVRFNESRKIYSATMAVDLYKVRTT